MTQPDTPPTKVIPASAIPALKPPKALIKVDLDDRCYAFPATTALTFVQLLVYRGDKMRIARGLAFNEAHSATEFTSLPPDAVAELARRIVEAVYRASSFLMVAGDTNINCVTHPNGYALQVGDFVSQRDLFVSPACIWRVANAVCRAADCLAVSHTH
jgi:hypothetical protein